VKWPYTLFEERPGDFPALTKIATGVCAYFSLVVRDADRSPGAVEFLKTLESFLVHREERSAWPGYGAARANRERVHVSVERGERGDFERNGIELLLVARTIAARGLELLTSRSIGLARFRCTRG